MTECWVNRPAENRVGCIGYSRESQYDNHNTTIYITIYYLVVVLHQLNDHTNVIAVVLDRNDAHDVGRIFRIGILTVFVREHQARVGLVYLWCFEKVFGGVDCNKDKDTITNGRKRLQPYLLGIKCVICEIQCSLCGFLKSIYWNWNFLNVYMFNGCLFVVVVVVAMDKSVDVIEIKRTQFSSCNKFCNACFLKEIGQNTIYISEIS